MKRLIAWAVGFAFSASVSIGAAPLPLKGSDTLELVTKDVISLCSLGALISYVGGGSGTGQAAMVAGTQLVAPMSRELNGTACTASASQLLIGLDGISIVTSNQIFGDSIDQTVDTIDDCSDTIDGGNSLTVAGCTAADGWLSRSPFPKHDPALAQIVGRHFDMDPIANDRLDAETPHFAGGIGNDPMFVVETHAEAPIGIYLVDQSLDGQ